MDQGLAAATAFAPSERGMWAVAYLVLVAGVAQVGLGVGQALLAPRPPSRRIAAAALTTWNVGNGAVLVGSLLDVITVVDIGAALLVACLVLLLRTARGAGRRQDWSLYAFRLLVGVLLVSIPIGLLLARVGPV